MGLALMVCRRYENTIAEHDIAVELNLNTSFGHWAFGFTLAQAEPAKTVDQSEVRPP